MVEAPDVDALMQGELGAWLKSQQQLRDDTRKKMWTRGIGCGVPFALLVIALALAGADMELIPLIGIGIAGISTWLGYIRRPVVNAMKERMNKAIAAAIGLDFALTGEQGRDWPLMLALSFLPAHDKWSLEDFWSGTLNGFPLRLYEAHLQQWQGSGKNRKLVTVFRGVIIEIGYGRPFRGTTLIERRGTRFKFFGLVDDISALGIKLEQAHFTHPELEKNFDLWTSDPVEAQYLVHPLYVERLIAVERHYHGQQVRALFHDGRMIIAIRTEPQFESGSLNSGEDARRLKQTIEQFMAVARLADSLYDAPGKLAEAPAPSAPSFPSAPPSSSAPSKPS